MSVQTLSDRLDKALGILIKLFLAACVAGALLSLGYCSDDSLRSARQWADDRLGLVGIKLKEAELPGLKLDLAVAPGLEIDADAAKSLALELNAVAPAIKSPAAAKAVRGSIEQLEKFATRLDARDQKVFRAIAAGARPLAPAAAPIDAWVYLGRKSDDGQWAPRSERIALSGPDAQPVLAATRDVVLVDVDPALSTAPSLVGDGGRVRFIRQGTAGIAVSSLVETQSVGKGKLVWGRVSVDAASVSESKAL